MAFTINEHYLDTFIGKYQNRLAELDADLQAIAAASQRNARANLTAGQTVHGYRPTTVFGEEYQEQAKISEDAARRDVEAMFDRLDLDAMADRTEAVKADEAATVTLALSLDPDEGTLRDLWTVHRHNSTLRRAIKRAASKAGVVLPTTIADLVADNREDARELALRSVANRWSPAGRAEMEVMPSAGIDAQSVRQHLLGVDLFGRPID